MKPRSTQTTHSLPLFDLDRTGNQNVGDTPATRLPEHPGLSLRVSSIGLPAPLRRGLAVIGVAFGRSSDANAAARQAPGTNPIDTMRSHEVAIPIEEPHVRIDVRLETPEECNARIFGNGVDPTDERSAIALTPLHRRGSATGMERRLTELKQRADELASGNPFEARRIVRHALLRRAGPQRLRPFTACTDLRVAHCLLQAMDHYDAFQRVSPEQMRKEIFRNAAGHDPAFACRLANLLDDVELKRASSD